MMSGRSVVLGASAALLLLSGCTNEPPWVLHRSSNAITLRWYADSTSAADAHRVASRFCELAGKSAELGKIERDGSAAITHYHCG